LVEKGMEKKKGGIPLRSERDKGGSQRELEKRGGNSGKKKKSGFEARGEGEGVNYGRPKARKKKKGNEKWVSPKQPFWFTTLVDCNSTKRKTKCGHAGAVLEPHWGNST